MSSINSLAKLTSTSSTDASAANDAHGLPVMASDSVNSTSANLESDTCDMVSNIPIPPQSEVFNTYGERLTNAQLLARYGFMLEVNDNDVVVFDVEDMRPAWSFLAQAKLGTTHSADRHWSNFLSTLDRVLQLWPRHERWQHSGLVYQPYDNATPVPSTVATYQSFEGAVSTPRSSTIDKQRKTFVRQSGSRPMHVSCDAKISHALWVSFAMLATVLSSPRTDDLSMVERSAEETVADLQQLAARQLFWELRSESESARDGHEVTEDDDEGNTTVDTAEQMKQDFTPTYSEGDEVSFLILGDLRRVSCQPLLPFPGASVLRIFASSWRRVLLILTCARVLYNYRLPPRQLPISAATARAGHVCVAEIRRCHSRSQVKDPRLRGYHPTSISVLMLSRTGTCSAGKRSRLGMHSFTTR